MRGTVRFRSDSGLLSEMAVVAVAGALFVLIFAVRSSVGGTAEGIAPLYVIPIALIAMRFGLRGGLVAATIALLLLEIWLRTASIELTAVGHLARAAAFFGIGGSVGFLSSRLTESEKRFRVAVDNLLEPFAIYSAVRGPGGNVVDFVIEFVNAAGCESLGLEPEDLVGKRLLDELPGRLESGLFDEYRAIVETGKPMFRDAFMHVDLLGEQKLVRALDMRAFKMDDGVAAVWRDVTAQRIKEDQQSRLLALTESSADAIIGVSRDGVIESWNRGAEEIYGFDADYSIGKSASQILSPESPEQYDQIQTRSLAGEVVRRAEVVGTRDHHGIIPVSLTASPVRDESGAIVGVAYVVQPK